MKRTNFHDYSSLLLLLVLVPGWMPVSYCQVRTEEHDMQGLASLVRDVLSSKTSARREDGVARLKRAAMVFTVADVVVIADGMRSSEQELLLQTVAVRRPDQVVQEVISMVDRGKCSVQVASRCCQCVGGQTVPLLIKKANSSSRDVRSLVAVSLGLFLDHYPQSVSVLCRLAEDDDEGVSVQALFSLRKFGRRPDECVRVLRMLLHDNRPNVLNAALCAIPIVVGGDRECVSRMIEIAEDEGMHVDVRLGSIDSLGMVVLEDKDIQRILVLSRSSNEKIRETALFSIARQRSISREAQQMLFDRMSDGEVSEGLLNALRRCSIFYGDILPVVSEIVSGPTEVAVRREAAGCILSILVSASPRLDGVVEDRLIRALGDPDICVRGRIIHAVADYASAPVVRTAIERRIGVEPNERLRRTMESLLTE